MVPSAANTPITDLGLEEIIERAKRAFALKNFENAVDYYVTALELMTKQHGEDASEMADLYFLYGKALLENAISQTSVLGKDQVEEELESTKSTSDILDKNGSILSFSGDAEDSSELLPEGEETVIDLSAEAGLEDEVEEGDEAEPEDDFNAAWEVLDLARAIYTKQIDQEDDDEVKLKLADAYITLGDVSLETEKFDQAITDYSAGVRLKTDLLPLSSRQIAEAHYKLSIVLDLTSGRLAEAITHAEKALESVETRLAELRDSLNGQLEPGRRRNLTDVKGKGKGSLIRDDSIQDMTHAEIEIEIKELEGLKEDLALKVEELKTSPREPVNSAPALAAQELDQELNGRIAVSAESSNTVNDLTSMVVKKKKRSEDTEAGKRKAENSVGNPQSEKKAKLDS